MTWLLLISSSLLLMVGVAMMVLSRLEPAHSHIRDWAWSHIFLAFGLALGVALVPSDVQSLHYRIQATIATACIIASLAWQLAGASHYRGRPWPWRRTLPLFVAMLAFVLALALVHLRLAIIASALLLTGGALLAAWWLWRGGELAERVVSVCFVALGLVHLSGPLLDPLARSAATHVVGTYVQGVLAMALVLLSVRRAHGEAKRMGERLRQLYEQSMQGVVIVRAGQAVYANPAALQMFGLDRLDGARSIEAAMAPADREASRARWRPVDGAALRPRRLGGRAPAQRRQPCVRARHHQLHRMGWRPGPAGADAGRHRAPARQ